MLHFVLSKYFLVYLFKYMHFSCVLQSCSIYYNINFKKFFHSFLAHEVPSYFENFDLESIITPVNIRILHQLLKQANYDPVKTTKIIDGFTYGVQNWLYQF